MLSGGTDDEVLVVGAGAAGLGAAMRLAAARVSLTVLEARGRVGGRAYTVADAPFRRGSSRVRFGLTPLPRASRSDRP